MSERVVVVDYGSGNLRSAAKALERATREAGLAREIVVSGEAEAVATADRVVLPGVGAFGDCRAGLAAIPGMWQALAEFMQARARPLLGICVGMQLLADTGLEHGRHQGFGAIPGTVVPLRPRDPALKVPHMGWNVLEPTAGGRSHPILKGLAEGSHVYFVHGYHMEPEDEELVLARTDHGGPVVAMVGRDTLAGVQFHPEKSQRAGLAILTRFLEWYP